MKLLKVLTEERFIEADLEDAIKTLLSQAAEHADEYNIPEERFKRYLIDLINNIVY